MPDVRNGDSWKVEEGRWGGQWTEVKGKGEDLQEWVHYANEDKVLIHFADDHVYVERHKPGDKHFYHGVVHDNGKFISGTYLISSMKGEFNWTAKVNY